MAYAKLNWAKLDSLIIWLCVSKKTKQNKLMFDWIGSDT